MRILIFILTLVTFISLPIQIKAQTDDFNNMMHHAQNGDSKAQLLIGLAYFMGEYRDNSPIEKNYGQAIKWLTLSAESGDSYAQWHLGGMYLEGNGVVQDYGRAAKWLLASAKQGNVKARTNLSGLYYQGTGVEKDDLKAYAWASLAAFKGNENALNMVQMVLSDIEKQGLRDKADNLAGEYFKKYGVDEPYK